MEPKRFRKWDPESLDHYSQFWGMKVLTVVAQCSCVSLGSQCTQHEQSKILCCKCYSRKIPKDCQFNAALARAGFIDICCFHNYIRKQKDRDIQNHYPGQALGSCTLCVLVCPSWSSRATHCCTSSKHRRSPLSSLAPFPQIHFQTTQLSVNPPTQEPVARVGVSFAIYKGQQSPSFPRNGVD